MTFLVGGKPTIKPLNLPLAACIGWGLDPRCVAILFGLTHPKYVTSSWRQEAQQHLEVKDDELKASSQVSQLTHEMENPAFY